jgi:hypothetical protein
MGKVAAFQRGSALREDEASILAWRCSFQSA